MSSDLSSKIRATSSGPRKSCSDRRSIADVVLDHFEDGQILVDHSVQDRVQHIVDTLAELRRRCLELLPKFAQRSGIAVPHGDKVIVTGEDRHLAVADPVADQLGGLGDDVQLIVVDLELGRAQRVHGVVDRQRMEVIRRLDRAEFVCGGLAKRDPAEARAILV